MTTGDPTGWDLEVFYDGGCPLCRREINQLRRWDRRQRIRFTDIDAANFEGMNLGPSHDELMAQLHARLPDGSWIRGVEVFRRLYAAVGFGPLVFLSRLPLLSPLLEGAYRLFAKHRLRLTGRCTAQTCGAETSTTCPSNRPGRSGAQDDGSRFHPRPDR